MHQGSGRAGVETIIANWINVWDQRLDSAEARIWLDRQAAN